MDYINIDLPPSLESALTAMEKQFVLMRSSGFSIRDIAKKLNKSTRTICDWNKKFAKEVIGVRNTEFCNLQKKVIDSKTERLNFLKREFNRISKLIEKNKMDVDCPFSSYNKFFDLYIKISELMSVSESDILSVGIKFKDNIESEISLDETEPNTESENIVFKNENTVLQSDEKENVVNTELSPNGKQSKTNYNTKTPKKYEVYKKQRLR